MKKKFFMVAVDEDAKTAQRDAFTRHLRSLDGVGFWHHIARVWLVVDMNGTLTASGLRDKAREFMPGPPLVYLVVVEARPSDWASFITKDASTWLRKNLSSKDWE